MPFRRSPELSARSSDRNRHWPADGRTACPPRSLLAGLPAGCDPRGAGYWRYRCPPPPCVVDVPARCGQVRAQQITASCSSASVAAKSNCTWITRPSERALNPSAISISTRARQPLGASNRNCGCFAVAGNRRVLWNCRSPSSDRAKKAISRKWSSPSGVKLETGHAIDCGNAVVRFQPCKLRYRTR